MAQGLLIITPMNVMILKHVDIEGPGLIEDYLHRHKIPRRIIQLQSSLDLPQIEDFTHLVLLGGPMNVYEEDRYPFLKGEDLLIKVAIQRGKKILGICLGAQLIAKALGAKVFKAPAKEIGWYEVSLTQLGLEDPLFSNFPPRFRVFQWHEDTFEILEGWRFLVTSDPVTHQAFRYGENAYGLQFHLECTEEMIREWLENDEEEMAGLFPRRFSKEEILEQTKREIKTYQKRGTTFLRNFFGVEGM